MKTHDVLVAARKLIEKPEHWTQHAFARDKYGTTIFPLSSYAVSFCAVGACRWVVRQRHDEEAYAVKALQDATGVPVTTYNDSSSHDQVLSMFDKAIRNTRP